MYIWSQPAYCPRTGVKASVPPRLFTLFSDSCQAVILYVTVQNRIDHNEQPSCYKSTAGFLSVTCCVNLKSSSRSSNVFFKICNGYWTKVVKYPPEWALPKGGYFTPWVQYPAYLTRYFEHGHDILGITFWYFTTFCIDCLLSAEVTMGWRANVCHLSHC